MAVPSLGRFLIDLSSALLVGGALWFGSRSLVTRVVPDWRGAPARLAEAVVALAALVVLAQVLALVGGLTTGWIVIASVLFGLAGWLPGPSVGPTVVRQAADPPEGVGRGWALAALAAVAITVGQWSAGVWFAMRNGMTTNDTVLYHGPEVARFVQGGSPLTLGFGYSDPVLAYFPGNSELVHAVGVVLFGVDVASPFVTVGWLALAFLAAWTIGRPFGLGAVVVSAVAMVLVTPLLALSQPGGMYNDIVVIALLLAAIGLLVNGADHGWALLLPAAACGLALGTKLTALAFVGALTLALPWVSPSGQRLRNQAVWLATVAATGGVWFLRNLIRTGNPLPGLELDAGPVSLPNPPLPHSYAIVHYLGTDGIWRSVRPAIETLLGRAWWAILALAVAGMVLNLWRPRTRIWRVLGLTAAIAFVAYFFTPRTGGGYDTIPSYFPSNLRYITPSLAIGLALLPIAPPVARRLTWAWTPLLPIAVIVATVLISGTSRNLGAQLAAGGALLAAAALVTIRPRLPTVGIRTMGMAAAGLIVLAVVGAWRVERSYLEHRYIYPPWSLGNTLPEAARVALVGEAGAYNLYGAHFTRHVTEIGIHGPRGSFLPIETCATWRQALDRGRFQYVVLSPRLVTRDAGGLTLGSVFGKTTPELAWTRSDPHAKQVFTSPEGPILVYRLDRPLDPDNCPKRH